MCDTLLFKTPKAYSRSHKSDTDSDESIANSDGSTPAELSIVTSFDDIVRLVNQKNEENTNILEAFINLAEQAKLMWVQYKSVLAECTRLQDALTFQTENSTEIERRLSMARKMLDGEKQKRKVAEHELQQMRQHIDSFCRNVMSDNITRSQIPNNIQDQILQLTHGRKNWEEQFHEYNHLDTIREVNTTGSILSDLSYSRSENDLDSSKCLGSDQGWKKYRPSEGFTEEPAVKKRRSRDKVIEIGQTETVRATTTLIVNKDGPLTASSVIESVPNRDYLSAVPPNFVNGAKAQNRSPNIDSINFRQHQFQHKTIVMPDSCSVCEKRIRFGRSALRCKDCKSYCHPECKNALPSPCVPLPNTPSNRKVTGLISDYTPTCSPMVPALIVHCVNEIEQRGLNELGLYRIPGSEKDVKGLKERFMTGKGTPNLKEIDLHVLCGCIKDFLRSLNESLIPFALWKDFVQAVDTTSEENVEQRLYQTIRELPQPNRDTLAYIILHLQRIAKSPDCKMPINNLSKIFGPTIVGYSSNDVNTNQIMEETRHAVQVMDRLLKLPSDYWSNFVSYSQVPSSGKLQQTPSTDSLLRPITNGIFTPSSARTVERLKRKRGGRLFHTPPNFR